mgnify:FL=1
MVESVFHIEGSTSTLLGILNQFNGASELTYETILGTTINSKRDVFKDVEPPTLPVLRYFGIGLNGFFNTDDVNGHAPHQPLPTNMDLYEPIPIRCVPLENDLSNEERKKYRMRKVRTIGSTSYAMYWLKLIEYTPKKVEIIQKSPDGTESIFNLQDPSTINDMLNPVPPKLSTGGLTPLSQSRLIVRATGICQVTSTEIMEAINVLHPNNPNKAHISEMGFYTGCEIYINTTNKVDTPVLSGGKVVPVSDSPAPQGANNKEAVYVQLSKHRCFTGVNMIGDVTFSPTISFEAGGTIDI